jgi:hypothetical protein
MFVRSIHKVDAQAASANGTQRPTKAITVCQIPGCAVAIERTQLMCPAHWFEVPQATRTDVYLTLDAWLKGRTNLRPYMVARLTALIHVCKLHSIDASALETKLDRVREDLRKEAAEGNNL